MRDALKRNPDPSPPRGMHLVTPGSNVQSVLLVPSVLRVSDSCFVGGDGVGGDDGGFLFVSLLNV